MPWSVYQVVLRLLSPLHIGRGKVSYLQRTYPYVTGRALRGALVNRVGRNQNIRGADAGDPFRCVSKTFASYLTFTYFFPALNENGNFKPYFPWEDEANFRRRFLGSYTGAALDYPQQTAAEGLLREIEHVLPFTRDDGDQVYLLGYIFAQENNLKKYDWKAALCNLQLGGERGYGWGRVQAELIEPLEPKDGKIRLFEQEVEFYDHDTPPSPEAVENDRDAECALPKHRGARPQLKLAEKARAWAHVRAAGAASVSGPIEPLVGREWRANNKESPQRRHIGQHLAFNEICYLPGSVVTKEASFLVGEGGIWQEIP